MTMMQVDLQRVGQWTEERVFRVDAERLRAYAAAINDVYPRHARGEQASPIFAVVPIGELLSPAVDGLIPIEDRRWGVHGAQDMFFYRPIAPGMVLRTKAAPIGVHPKRSGASVVIKTVTRDGHHELVNEQYVTLFIRRPTGSEGAGDQAPDHILPVRAKAAARMASGADVIDADQTYRYAEASGDDNKIHLDSDFARSVGLPGIIVHGMCTMAFASRVVIASACTDDPLRLRRLAARFARPVFPGQAITTHIWDLGERAGRRVYGFETVNPDGKAVIQDGRAEVAS